MRIIKNAFVYSVQLPAMDQLTVLLSDHQLQPPSASSPGSIGFVRNDFTDQWVTPISGGYSLAIQIDEKVLPSSAVAKKVAEKVADIEARQSRTVYKKERLQIKDDVIASMLPVAFIVSRVVHVFYIEEPRILILDTGSARVADTCLTLIRDALGTLKTIKLFIDDLSFTLTQKVYSFADGSAPVLGTFDLGGQIQLNGYDKRKFTFVAEDGDSLPLEEINQVIKDGCKVNTISLIGRGASFKLTNDCVFKSIRVEDAPDAEEYDDVSQRWVNEAGIETLIVYQQVLDLLALSGSLFPPEDKTAEG